MALDIAAMRDRIRFESPLAAAGITAAGAGTFEPVATVWASVVDTLPSRQEREDDGLTLRVQTTRIRCRYRTDIAGNMRIVVVSDRGDPRIFQIVSGPAVIGNRDGLEMMAETWTSEGGRA